MAEAVVSLVVERLANVIEQQIREEISLVVGVKKEVQGLTKKLNNIRTVLEDAEKRKVKETDVQGWLEELDGLSYDMDDVLDEWNTALLKAELEQVDSPSIPKPKLSFSSISSCFCLKQVSIRRDIASKIKTLNTRLEVIYNGKDQFKFLEGERIDSDVFKPIKTTSVVKESEVYGRDDDKDDLVSMLLDEGSTDTQEQDDVLVMSIVGTGGLGKTTLAQLVYNDEDVKDEFELRIWVCVSDPFDEIRVAKAILESLGKGKKSRDINELEELLKLVTEEISGKKFLLVLDDVWNEDERLWEPLRNSLENGSGGRVLVTTRNEKVAIVMGSAYLHRLGMLSDVHCWSLFRRIAFAGRKKEEGRLEGIGREIVKKCQGMPLATKTLAGLLRFKNTTQEWQDVLDSELWKLEVAAIKLFPHLYLSFCDVPPIMRRCFTYCAVFPKDAKIDVEDLIKLWMAQGYLATTRSEEEVEIRGREYFNDLAMRSLFQDFERDEFGEAIISCKMHDIVHDFAQFMAGKECSIVQNESGSNSSDSAQVRHLYWIACEELTCIPPACTTGKLRSFLADSVPENIFQDLLSNLKLVRSLTLKNADLEEIPKEISTLIHLRYLNLSDNPLSELPEEVCDLINLETLDISDSGIYELPRAIAKLINLRHLVISGSDVKDFPQSLEMLTSLRTFDKFVLKRGNKLGCLKNLNNLHGSLEITVDEDVDLVSEKIEMEKAELKCKKHIKKFQLMFYDQMWPEFFGDPAVLTDLIDVLGAPPNIEVLYLYSFPTTRLPTWITSLYSLRRLTIESGEICSSLPPLGRLPQLESLTIWYLPSCSHIGPNFLGVEAAVSKDTTKGTCSVEASSTSSSSSVVVAFPKLEKLVIRDCGKWEEWEDLTENDERKFVVFPQLHDLQILNCGRLKTLPPRVFGMATSLESLHIRNCDTFLDHHVTERGLSSHFEEHFMDERRVASSAYFDSKEAISEFLRRLK